MQYWGITSGENFRIFTHRNRREIVRVCQHSILETCAYQLRIFKSAFYSYNFHIFRLFGFGKEEVDVYRFMSKQFITLFVYLSFALSSLFLPPKCVVLFWEEKLVPFLSKRSHFMYIWLSNGTREPKDASFTFVQCLFCKNSSAFRADFLHQCDKIYRLTSKRL